MKRALLLLKYVTRPLVWTFQVIGEDIKSDPVAKLILPVTTTVVVYVALQLLPLILR